MGRWKPCAAMTAWCAILIVLILLDEAVGLQPAEGTLLGELVYGALYAGILAGVAWSIRTYAQRRTPVMYLLLAAGAAYIVGDYVSVYFTYVVNAEERALSDPGDALMLVAYGLVLMAVGTHLVRTGAVIDTDRVLDGCIVGVALGSLAWVAVIVPGLRSPAFESATAHALVAGMYPTLDLLLVVVAVAHVTGERPVSVSGVLLLVAPVMLLMADSLDFYNLLQDREAPLLSHFGWTVAYALCGVAAVVPRHTVLAAWDSSRPASWDVDVRRRWIYGLGLLPIALYGAQLLARPDHDRSVPDGPALAVAMLLMSGLVVARAGGMMRRAEAQSEDLASLARSDHLTTLPNRRTSDAELARAVARADSSGEPVTVALLDIDHFKAFNDEFGHHAGDELLRGCAQRWSALLGPSEVLARYGGEEFTLLTVGLPMSAVVALLDRMRAATPRGQSFSAGLAAWTPGESGADLVSRADEALYAAKANGRARTYLWEGGGAQPSTSGTEGAMLGGAPEAGHVL